MTTYISAGTIGGLSTDLLQVIEMRVQNTLLQKESASQEDLKQLRNDEAFGLGINPPVVPGN